MTDQNEDDVPLSPFAQASREVNGACAKHWALKQKLKHTGQGYAAPWDQPEVQAVMTECEQAFSKAAHAIQKREAINARRNEGIVSKWSRNKDIIIVDGLAYTVESFNEAP